MSRLIFALGRQEKKKAGEDLPNSVAHVIVFLAKGYTPPSNIVIRSWWSRCGTGGSGNDATLTNPRKVRRKWQWWQWWQWRPPPSCCFLDQQPAADVPIAGAENLWPTPASKIFIASLQKSNKLQTF